MRKWRSRLRGVGDFLVYKGGVVGNIYMGANWHERLEPEVAVGWIDALEG
jgi:hypothetical protein